MPDTGSRRLVIDIAAAGVGRLGSPPNHGSGATVFAYPVPDPGRCAWIRGGRPPWMTAR